MGEWSSRLGYCQLRRRRASTVIMQHIYGKHATNTGALQQSDTKQHVDPVSICRATHERKIDLPDCRPGHGTDTV